MIIYPGEFYHLKIGALHLHKYQAVQLLFFNLIKEIDRFGDK